MIQFDWRVDPSRLIISNQSDGSHIKLGSGGFGSVYKAVLDNVHVVAVKFLEGLGLESSGSAKERFAFEIEVLKACRHPNVISFLGGWIAPVPPLFTSLVSSLVLTSEACLCMPEIMTCGYTLRS